MLTKSQAEEIISPILRTALEPFGLNTLTIETGVDHDGDPSIYANATYKPKAPQLDIDAYIHAANSAMQELSSKGDERFIYVRHFYVDGDAVPDDYAPKAAKKKKVA